LTAGRRQAGARQALPVKASFDALAKVGDMPDIYTHGSLIFCNHLIVMYIFCCFMAKTAFLSIATH